MCLVFVIFQLQAMQPDTTDWDTPGYRPKYTLQDLQNQLMKLDKKPSTTQTIDKIPDYCTHLIENLNNQPTTENNTKVLSIDSFDHGIYSTLCKNIKKILGKQNNVVQITSSWNGYNLQCSNQAQTGYLYDNQKEDFATIIALSKQGWQMSTQQDYDEVKTHKDLNNWSLYIKNNSVLLDEAILLQNIISKFDLSCWVECDNRWKEEPTPEEKEEYNEYVRNFREGTAFCVLNAECIGNTYLWIRNDSIYQIQEILGLELKY